MKFKLSNLTSKFRTHNKVGDKLWTWLYIGIYITYILTKYKEIWRTLLIPRPTHPSIQPIKLGATRLVRKLRWTPEGECTGLVETSAAIKIESPTWHKILTKKACGRLLIWKTLLLAWFFKNTFPHKSFENEIQTLQLDIKFSNP